MKWVALVVSSFAWAISFCQLQSGLSLFPSNQLDSNQCYRIPALVTTPSGHLLAACDERLESCADLRANEDINIVLRRSKDGGHTWGPIERIVDFPSGQSASDPSFIVDEENGTIWLFYNYMNLAASTPRYRFHALKSQDNGKTWSQATDITSQISKESWVDDFMFITSGRGIQDQAGGLLHCMVHVELGVQVFGSTDHGTTWKPLGPVLSPGDESKIVQLVDGTYLVNSRVAKTGHRYVHTSLDRGRTWSSRPAPELIDPACNASILQTSYQGQEVLFFSNLDHVTQRQNLVVRHSLDGGKSWSSGVRIEKGSAAYSSLVQIDAERLGILFEAKNYRDIIFKELLIADLLD